MNIETIASAAASRAPVRYREDAFSIATLAALEAEKTYDPARNDSVQAWMAFKARGAVLDFLRRETVRSATLPLWEGIRTIAAPFRWVEERDHILTTLDGQEATILFADALGYRTTEISARCGLSVRRVQEERSAAREKIAPKNPAG